MTYDRRAAFDVTGHFHYESPEEDAGYIASEVIRYGKSRGWSTDPSEQEVARQIAKILSKYNIGLIDPHAGVWGHRPGGTHSMGG